MGQLSCVVAAAAEASRLILHAPSRFRECGLFRSLIIFMGESYHGRSNEMERMTEAEEAMSQVSKLGGLSFHRHVPKFLSGYDTEKPKKPEKTVFEDREDREDEMPQVVDETYS